MKLPRWLHWGVVGISIAFGSGCAHLQKQPSQPLTFEEHVQKELRKQDPIMVQDIQQEYQTGSTNKEKRVRINLVPGYQQEQNREMRLNEYHGAYEPFTDKLLLPEPATPHERIETIDALDHELIHALFDADNKKGFIHSSSYLGPSLETIATFTNKKIMGHAFASVREKIEAKKEFEQLYPVFHKLTSTISQETHNLIRDFKRSAVYMKDGEMYASHIPQPLRDELSQRKSELEKRIQTYGTGINTFLNTLVEDIAKYEVRRTELTKADMQNLQQKITNYLADRAQHQQLGKDVALFGQNVLRAYDDAEDSYLKKIITRLKEENDTKGAETFQRIVESTRSLREQARSFQGIANSMSASIGNLSQLSVELIAAQNSEATQAILSPEETFARVVDSLYSLYYGPVTQNKFPLASEDISFLRTFRYRDGEGREQLIFRKGIERYELGLRRIREEGISPERVKRELEHATFYTYKGNHYRWPESKVTIQGTFPYQIDKN